MPSKEAIHTSGIPSAMERSLRRMESRNAAFFWLAIRKFKFGVDRKHRLESEAVQMRCMTSLVFTASNGKPRIQCTGRRKSVCDEAQCPPMATDWLSTITFGPHPFHLSADHEFQINRHFPEHIWNSSQQSTERDRFRPEPYPGKDQGREQH